MVALAASDILSSISAGFFWLGDRRCRPIDVAMPPLLEQASSRFSMLFTTLRIGLVYYGLALGLLIVISGL